LLPGERRFHVRRRDLFGSAAGNDYDPARSDLDFLVEFGAAATGAYADAFFGLKESLEQLFGRPMGLVAAAAIRNPHFRKSAEAPSPALCGMRRRDTFMTSGKRLPS
jgi:predicted nucleotidyltransferase